MIDPKDEREILRFINNRGNEFKRKHRFISSLLLPLIPNFSTIASEIPQCAMNYTLKEILDFLTEAQQDGRIRI